MSGARAGSGRWRRYVPAAVALTIVAPAAAWAWRETGHFAVCEIAYRNLRPATRAEVDAIAGPGFARQCTWPDIVRRSPRWQHTYDWHFINLDPGQAYFAPGNVNPEGDVLQGLLLAEAKLADERSTVEERRTFLRFLAHFAGDAHQPLHAGHLSDLGGNTVEVRWFGEAEFDSPEIVLAAADAAGCEAAGGGIDTHSGECVRRRVRRRTVNLHKVWDLLMIERFLVRRGAPPVPGDSEFRHLAYARALAGLLGPRQIDRAVRADFWEWVEESLELRRRAYRVGDGELGRRYYRRNIGRLNRRVALAGHRLAATLDRLLAPQADPAEARRLADRHATLRQRLVALAGADSPLARGLAAAPAGR